jgi:hypothetical protein
MSAEIPKRVAPFILESIKPLFEKRIFDFIWRLSMGGFVLDFLLNKEEAKGSISIEVYR